MDEHLSPAILRGFFDLSKDLLCISGMDGYFKALNPAWEETLGYSRAELLSTPFLNLIHPDDVFATRAEFERLCGGQPTDWFENRYRCHDGTYKCLLWKGVPVLESHTIYGIARDIGPMKTREVEAGRVRASLESRVVRRTAALRKSQDTLREVMDHLPGMAYRSESDDARAVEYVSAGSTGLTGYSPAELRRGRHIRFADLILDQDREAVRRAVEGAVGRREEYRVDYRIRTVSGETKWVRDIGRAEFDDRQKVRHLTGLVIDITRATEVERARRQSEERFREIAESITEVFYLTDSATHEILYVSPGYEEIWKRSCESLCQNPRSWLDNIHPDDRARVREAADREADGSYDVNYRIVRPDGSIRWIHDKSFVVTDGDGHRGRVAGVADDITGQVEAETAARENEALFRAVVEQPLIAVYVIQDSRIVYANPKMRELFGYGPEDPFEPDPLKHVQEAERARAAEQMGRRLTGEPEGAYTLGVVRKDGSTFDMSIHARRTTYRNGPAIIAIAEDVTEKLRTEAQIREYIARIEKGFRGTVEVVARIGDARDPYTQGHERRVGDLAAEIATEMGIASGVVEGIRIAGYMHDVGKIGVPSEILAMPRKLKPAEYEIVKSHAALGYDILKGVDFPWPVARVALEHHERLNGTGYPAGLKGDQICVEARILAVADTVEAMASHRPYRAGLGIEAALTEVGRYRGVLYDAQAVDACLRLFREKRYQLTGT